LDDITLAFASYLFVEPYMDACKAVATSMREPKLPVYSFSDGFY
jgi:hypothetical protein